MIDNGSIVSKERGPLDSRVFKRRVFIPVFKGAYLITSHQLRKNLMTVSLDSGRTQYKVHFKTCEPVSEDEATVLPSYQHDHTMQNIIPLPNLVVRHVIAGRWLLAKGEIQEPFEPIYRTQPPPYPHTNNLPPFVSPHSAKNRSAPCPTSTFVIMGATTGATISAITRTAPAWEASLRPISAAGTP